MHQVVRAVWQCRLILLGDRRRQVISRPQRVVHDLDQFGRATRAGDILFNVNQSLKRVR